MSPDPPSAPGERRGFADQIDWLLTMVPRTPGSSGRFGVEDLISALASGQPRHRDRITRARALTWLAAARTGQPLGTTALDQHRVAVLEDLFRLPPGYFRDESTRRATDERIAFAVEAAARGVTVVGPCRTRSSQVGIEALHSVHVRARELLDRRTGS